MKTDFLGPNWRTTVYGVLSRLFLGFLICAVFQPELIVGVFGEGVYSKKIIGAATLLWFILGNVKDFNAKDKQVAGNNPDVVTEGNVQTKVTTL